MDEIKLTAEEREERINRIIQGLKDLGYEPSDAVRISSLFSSAEKVVDEVAELDDLCIT